MKTWVRKSLKVGILSAGFLLVGGAAAAQAASGTSDNFGVVGGNQVQADAGAPISVSGNAIGLLGSATANGAASGGGAMVAPNASDTSGNFGIGDGNQITPVVAIPIDICGNAIGLLGGADAGCGAGSGNGGGYDNG